MLWTVLTSLVAVMCFALAVFGLMAVFAPKLCRVVMDPRRLLQDLLSGRRPQGRPIEVIAADLRRVLVERDQLSRSRSEWYVTHDMRVCERNLHDVAEEAAKALGLDPCPAPVGGWTTVHLEIRIRELADAGMVLER